MPNYYVNEAVFALPAAGYVDRTLHRLEAPLPGTEPLGVEVRRVPIARGKLLRELVDDDTAATKAKVNGFAVVEQADVALSGAPAVLIRARYRARDVAYYQLKAHVAVDGTWIVVVVTGPYAERAACDETFDGIVQSLAWRSA
jgi:hypothetical protein